MKTLQKLFLLSVLGLGVYVNETFATSKNAAIYAIVNNSLTRNKLEINSLPKILTAMKKEILAVIANDPYYTELKKALDELNTDNLMAAYMQLQKVIQHAPTDTQSLIRSTLKQYGLRG